MLSSALQKANTAVLLDNANNIEGAMEAYSDACALLGHVMMRAGVDEDRRKLQQIVRQPPRSFFDFILLLGRMKKLFSGMF